MNAQKQMTTAMPKRILLCDDEAHILRAAEFKFKRAGYEVICASDGQEGWERIQEKRPDIVVRSEEHTSELQSPCNLVCRLLLEKKKNITNTHKESLK